MRLQDFVSEARYNVRGTGGRYAPRPVPRPLPPREKDTLNFEPTPGIKPVQPGNAPQRVQQKPQPAPQQQSLGLNDTTPKQGEIQKDAFNDRSDPKAKGLNADNPNNPQSADQQWQTILGKASQNTDLGKQIMSLLGAMYQAKRRNPGVQQTTPQMITAMRVDTPEQKNIQQRLQQVFQLAQRDGLPQLAARSQQLQQSRRMGSATSATQQQRPSRGMQTLQQLTALIRKASPQELGKIRDEVDSEIKNKTSNQQRAA